MDTKVQFGALVLATVGLATIFGLPLARLKAFGSRPLDKTIRSREWYRYNKNRIIGIEQIIQKINLSSFIDNFTNNQSLETNNRFIDLSVIY